MKRLLILFVLVSVAYVPAGTAIEVRLAPTAPGPASPPAAPAPTIAPSPPHEAPDIQFVADLIGQHEDAIAKAKRIIASTDDPDLRALAEQTILQNEREIARLREWQKSH